VRLPAFSRGAGRYRRLRHVSRLAGPTPTQPSEMFLPWRPPACRRTEDSLWHKHPVQTLASETSACIAVTWAQRAQDAWRPPETIRNPESRPWPRAESHCSGSRVCHCEDVQCMGGTDLMHHGGLVDVNGHKLLPGRLGCRTHSHTTFRIVCRCFQPDTKCLERTPRRAPNQHRPHNVAPHSWQPPLTLSAKQCSGERRADRIKDRSYTPNNGTICLPPATHHCTQHTARSGGCTGEECERPVDSGSRRSGTVRLRLRVPRHHALPPGSFHTPCISDLMYDVRPVLCASIWPLVRLSLTAWI